jgi:hypothetical protein
MGRRLILDTGVLAAAERGRVAIRDIVDADDDTALSVVTLTPAGPDGPDHRRYCPSHRPHLVTLDQKANFGDLPGVQALEL